ncbi:MAG: ribosome silencing factor [Lachnospiraceae bacterium]|nr:ribosome silencing factor [Lachnospiraceae bacterium]
MAEKKDALMLARKAIYALEDKKAKDIKVIDISEVSVLADYFIIASGRNSTQIQTLSDAVIKALGEEGVTTKQVEGYQNAQWVLLDFGDLIVHIFDEENRLFYDLERIWLDGKQINPEEL